MARPGRQGMALMIVLGVLLVVVILANVVLGLMSSHSTLTFHKIRRIQAYYAAKAGMTLALDNLRTGAWHFRGSGDNSCPASNPCSIPATEFPNSNVTGVGIIFCPRGDTCRGSVCTVPGSLPDPRFCVQTVVNYSSQ